MHRPTVATTGYYLPVATLPGRFMAWLDEPTTSEHVAALDDTFRSGADTAE